MTVPDSGAATSPALPAPPELGNIPADHPLWSGEFVAVNQSSNVHSAAYDYREAALYVRFHEKEYNKDVGDWVPVGPGPIYAYYNVPPSMFLDLLETRSPGNWVWDHLRIRGTVSGHRFDYRLVAISGTYVPRKATFGPLKSKEYEGLYGEMFVPRIVPGPTGKWLQSLNPYEVVRVFEPQEPISPDQAVLFGL
ncbi:KTSC domain-containing protein [Thermopirellula anaerolimosa]